MAEIRTNPQSLFTQPIGPSPPADTGGTARGLAAVGRGVADLGVALLRAKQYANSTAARKDISSRMTALQQELSASADPDAALKSFEEGARAIQNEASEQYGIDETTKQMIGVAYQQRFDQGYWSLWQRSHDNQVRTARADLQDYLAQVQQDAAEDQTLDKAAYKGMAENAIKDALEYGFINPEEESAFRRGVNAALDGTAARTVIDADPALGVNLLEAKTKGGDFANYTGITPETRRQLLAQANREMELRGRVSQKAINDLIRDDLNSVFMHGQGIAGARDRLVGMGADEYTLGVYDAERVISEEGNSVLEQGRYATPAGRQELLTSSRPTEGEDNFTTKMRMWETLGNEFGRIEKAITQDPMGYVSSRIPEELKGQERIAQGYRLQESIGVPNYAQQPLSVIQAQGLVGQYMIAPADTKVGIMLQLQAESEDYWPEVQKQLVGENLPTTAVLMTIVQPVTAEKLAQVEGLKISQLKEGLERGEAQEIVQDVYTGLQDFLATQPPGSVKQQLAFQNVAVKIALYNRGQGVDDPARTAVEELFGRQYTIRGTMRVPKEQEDAIPKIDQMTQAILSTLNDLPLLIPGGIPQEVYAETVRAGAEWYISPKEDGYWLYSDGQPVLAADGSVVGFTFADARATPDPVKPTKAEWEARHAAGSAEMDAAIVATARNVGRGVAVLAQIPGEALESALGKVKTAFGDAAPEVQTILGSFSRRVAGGEPETAVYFDLVKQAEKQAWFTGDRKTRFLQILQGLVSDVKAQNYRGGPPPTLPTVQ